MLSPIPIIEQPRCTRWLRRTVRATALLCALVISTACSSGESITAAAPDAVDVSAPASSMLVGASQALSVRVTARGNPVPAASPTWSTSDGTILSVSAGGQVTALARGTATVTAAVGAARGSVSLTVLGVRAVAVLPATLSLPVGNSVTLTTAIDADAGVTSPAVTWSSSNPTAVTVNATGVITGIATGSATITATSQGRSGTATISVIPAVTVSSVVVTPPSATLAVGGTQQLTALVRDSAGNAIMGRTVVWTSANLAVAQVSASGLVTGVAPGTTNVTATVDGRSASANLMIQGPVTSLAVSPATATVALGGTQAFIAIAKDALGQVITGRPVTWSIANASVATISGQGVVTGVAPGTTTLTATSEGQRATATVTVEGLGGIPPNTIVAGLEHSCAIMVNNRAACWGSGGWGQLGDGERGFNDSPYPVSGDLAFATLASGTQHMCGITTTGRLYCWGRNEEGQIGDGTTTLRTTPVPINPSATFKAVAAGQGHTCALTTSGTAYCWGQNANGQLGDGTTTSRSTPVPVSGTPVFNGLTAGTAHSCGWTASGSTWCWGNNGAGRLGDGTITQRLTPTLVSGGLVLVEVSAGGEHSCGRTDAGVVYCWGRGSDGQLGSGSQSAQQLTPGRISGSTPFARISAGATFTCGLSADAAAYCWGRNVDGELGDGGSAARSSPAPVNQGGDAASIGSGARHACLIGRSGAAKCWGYNGHSQLGFAEVVSVPKQVAGAADVQQLSGGYFYTCGLMRSGQSVCWGSGNPTPTSTPGNKLFTAIESGGQHTCGLDSSQIAWCWGANANGELGTGSLAHQDAPVAVSGGFRFAKLTTFYTFSCGIDTGGILRCWGANHVGQIDDSKTARTVPTAIATTLRFSDVSVANYHGCGIATAGTMHCWGDMATSNPTLPSVISQPMLVAPDHRFVAVASTTNNSSCGIRTDRKVVCIGQQWNFGTGRLVDGLPDAIQIEGYSNAACAIAIDRTVYCWGANERGELGDPSAPTSWTPRATRVPGITDAVALGGSYFTPCAAVASGAVFCWGFNGNGEAGQPLPRVPRAVSGGMTFKGP